jgi:hypothetical protein
MAVELTPEQLTAIATVVIAPVIVGTFAIWHEYLKAKKKPELSVEIPATLKQLEEDLERIERWQERIIDRLDDIVKMQLLRK